MVPRSGHDVPAPDPTLRPLTAASAPSASSSLVAREALRLTALADAQAALDHIASKPRSPVSPRRQAFTPQPRTRQPLERDATPPSPQSGHPGQPAQERMNANTGAQNAPSPTNGNSYANAAAAPPAEGGSPAAGAQSANSNTQQGRGSQQEGSSEQAQGPPQGDARTSKGRLWSSCPFAPDALTSTFQPKIPHLCRLARSSSSIRSLRLQPTPPIS